MFEKVRMFGVITRAEFIMPNLGSLIMGLAWGASPPLGLLEFAVLVVLSFCIINLSSAIGAQANTLSDIELDSRDERKGYLVHALDSFGRVKLERILIAEVLLASVLVVLFSWVQSKPVLLLMWIIGISLGCAYSAKPLRLKSKSWLAPVSLIVVLAVLPVLFAYFAFTDFVNLRFILALAGLALTVYAVIIPTEVRDYFGDKAMNIETVTVHLGLAKASLLSMVLLSTGAALTVTAFLLELVGGLYPLLAAFLVAMVLAVLFVLTKIRKLLSLSRKFAASNGESSIAEEIVSFSAQNPRWIMMVTQSYSLLSVILLVSKFLT